MLANEVPGERQEAPVDGRETDWRAALPDDLRSALQDMAEFPPTTYREGTRSVTEKVTCDVCGGSAPGWNEQSVQHCTDCVVLVVKRYF